MTIAVAGFTHESNTFAPEPTRLADFGARKGGGVPHGDAVFERVETQSSFQGFCAAARAAGCRLHPVLHAYAPPGGPIEREAFESLADRILVMFDGQIVGEADPATATERDLGLMMAGIGNKAAPQARVAAEGQRE